ncbi:MAG: GNAT family N-acetyltransferase [Thermoleophilia bacterium]|nr:GNAT family N-acetyltransferase [Thermoleophilia bacterium]
MRLVEPRLEQILEFCAADPVERVFLEDAARRGFGSFVALADGPGLTALCFLGVNLVPSGTGCGVFADAAVRRPPLMIIGDERAVGELWDAVSGRLAKPREDRPRQPVFVIREPPPPGRTGLRAASLGDLDLLVPACARAHREELGLDPLERDAAGFRWRTRTQIDEGRSWIWRDGDTILFKAEASAWTPSAVQLQQVWVDPDARGRGFAQRGLRDLIRLLLHDVPTVCLFVRPENAPAIRVYEAVGMRRRGSYRSVVF